MSSQASLALVRQDGKVVTFVRADVPENWAPPDGLAAVPAHGLPAGWQLAEDESPVPPTVTARQIRLWLLGRGVSMGDVDAAIDGIPDEVTRDTVRVEWEYAPYVERAHQMLVPLAAALGLSEADIDQAFREAAAL